MSTFTFEIDEFLEHRNEREFIFPLVASSIGRKKQFQARVRRLQLMDRASIGFLPDHLQNEAWKQLRAANNEIERRQEAGEAPKDINEALANNDAMLQLADLFCQYGFIEPQIVTDVAHEDIPSGKLHAGRFAPEDRVAYLIACNDAHSEQAKLFETFRDQREGAPSGGNDGEVAPVATIGPAGHPGYSGDGSAPV